MKRIGKEIPGWPAYTIDDNLTVRSYQRQYCVKGEGQILVWNRNEVRLRRLGKDGKSESLIVTPKKLMACVNLGIDPSNINLKGLVVDDNGDFVDSVEFAKRMAIRGMSSIKQLKIASQGELINRIESQIRMLNAEIHYLKTGDMEPILGELEDMKTRVKVYLEKTRLTQYWTDDIFEELFSRVRDLFIKGIQQGEYYSNPFYTFVYKLQELMREIRRRNANKVRYDDNILIKNYGSI